MGKIRVFFRGKIPAMSVSESESQVFIVRVKVVVKSSGSLSIINLRQAGDKKRILNRIFILERDWGKK